MRGFAAESEASTDETATDMLRAKREGETATDTTDETTSDWKLSEWRTGRTREAIDKHRDLLERAEDLERPPRTVHRDE